MAKEIRMEMLYVRRPCFYTFFSSTLSSERLKIPVRFVRHFEGKTSGLVSLMGPSGHTWNVDLIQQNDDIFFDHRWPTFVRDHLLECGDFLVFRYDGELHFTVQIFDQSTCEKEAAFHSQCSQDTSIVRLKREREEAVSSSDTASAKKLKSFSELLPVYKEKNRESKVVLFDENRCQEADLSNIIKHSGSQLIEVEDKACMSLLLAHDEKIVAQSFTSHFPYFVRIMKSFNISGSYTLNIPYQFSMAHLPNCKIKIVLQNLKGECWTVNSVPATRVHTSHTLCGGWMAFVRGNDINMGDVCVFELVRECELLVHVLRVGKELSENHSGKGTLNGVSVGCAVISSKKVKSLSKKLMENSPKVKSKSKKKGEISKKKVLKSRKDATFSNDVRKRGSTKASLVSVRSKTKVSCKSLVLHGRGVEDDPGLRGTHGLRMMLALDEEKAARSFISCFPSFVRIMKRFNISGSYTLKIPHQFSAAHFPSCKTEILLCNLNGQCWTVNSVPDSMGRMVHTFCGGWMAFVRDNKVNIGDICIFELVGNCEFRVHISGVGKKGFDYNNGEATCNELALVPSTSNHPL